MTTKIKGTEGIEFPDSTVQATAADNGPIFKAVANVPTVLPQNTSTKCQYNQELFDSHNFYDAINSRFQPAIAGWYMFSIGVRLSSAAAQMILTINKNGVGDTIVQNSDLASRLMGSGIAYLNGTTDYVEAFVYQSEVTQDSFVDPPSTYFSGFFVGRAP
jgi:hypothetical protein